MCDGVASYEVGFFVSETRPCEHVIDNQVKPTQILYRLFELKNEVSKHSIVLRHGYCPIVETI